MISLIINLKQKSNILPKPILKWVGGKTQILDKIISIFPTTINNYHEIFLGSGSVLFGLLHLVSNDVIKIDGYIYAYDVNLDLINMYKTIQSNPNKLYKEIKKIINDNIVDRKATKKEDAMKTKEAYYYWIRKR